MTSATAMQPPPCPITGRPAIRMIQRINIGLLIKLWRHTGGVELGHLLHPLKRLELWESPVGLAFFHPMVEGDGALYPAFYRNTGADRWLFDDPDEGRAEFAAAAELIEPSWTVLDVGCGRAPFRRRIPQARYVGLEPFWEGEDRDADVRRETAEAHAAAHAGEYDAVCGFEVLEHVADPRRLAEAMARMVKPGGLLILGVPSWPSPLVEIPNLCANAVPHHLSWWTVGALEALCQELGLEVVAARDLPAQKQHRLFHWARWFSPVKAAGPYWRHAWSWHFSLLFAYLMARIAALSGRLPPNARSLDCFIAARKPQ